MKISLLLDREPFDKIFEETLASFLYDITNCPHYVNWCPKSHNKQSQKPAQIWYCNPLINSIFVKGVNPAVFDSINGEYSHNPLRPWRSLIQKLYLRLSQYNKTALLMAKYIIEVSPPIEDAKNKMIIGGNTKIRMIDIPGNKVYVILKNGFDKKYLAREVFIRENYQFLPVPKIILKGNDDLWYAEEYISGISPDRMRYEDGLQSLISSIESMRRVIEDTKKIVTLNDYVQSIVIKINTTIEAFMSDNNYSIKQVQDVASALIHYLNQYSNCFVITSFCHGDFQAGNIICDGKKSWIIDWEHSGRKQFVHDLYVMQLKSRIKDGFNQRFLEYFQEGPNMRQKVLNNYWPDLQSENQIELHVSMVLFLLEELDFHLEELKSIPTIANVQNTNSYCSNIAQIIKSL
jgi:hypothetical protein